MLYARGFLIALPLTRALSFKLCSRPLPEPPLDSVQLIFCLHSMARQVRKAFCSLLPPDPPIHSSTACFHPLPTKLATIRFQVFSPCFPVPRGRERVGEGWQYTVTAEDEGHVIVFQFTPVSSTGGRSTCPRWRLSAQQVGKQWWWSSTGRWGHALALQVHGALIACRVTVK